MDNVFLLLVKNSIMAGFMAVFIILLVIIGKNHISSKIRYYLWWLVILRLMVPFSWESPISIVNLGSKFLLPQAETALVPANPNSAIYQIVFPAQFDNAAQEAPAGIGGVEFSPNQTNMEKSNRSISLISILSIMWLTGAVLFLLVYILALIRFNRKLARSIVCTDKNMLTIFDRIKQEMNINRDIPIIYEPTVNTPSIFSVLRPKLIIPVNMMRQFTPQEIEFVLRHELTHYQRRDLLIFNIVALLQVIYWFNPLLWYAFYQMRLDCESSCDAEVLQKLRPDQYQPYGLTLLKVIALFPQRGLPIANLGLGKTYNHVKRRMDMIVNFKNAKMKKKAIFILAAILALGAIIFYTDPLTSSPLAKASLFNPHSDTGLIVYDADKNRLVVPKTEQVKTIKDIQQQDAYWQNTYIFRIDGPAQSQKYVVDSELIRDVVTEYSGNTSTITVTSKQLIAFTASEDKNNFYFTPAKAQEIYKYIVVLDPAHGGEDDGAILEPQLATEIFALAGVDMEPRYKDQEIKEKDMTLALAQSIELIANNAGGNELKVYLTRQDDEMISLERRADMANAIGGICLNLHYNMAPPGSNRAGTETYYYEETNAECKRLAEILQAKLTQDLGTQDLGTKPSNLYIIRNVQGPVVNVEVAYLNSSHDLTKILSEGFIEKTALSLLNGLRQYFGMAGEIVLLPAAETQDLYN